MTDLVDYLRDKLERAESKVDFIEPIRVGEIAYGRLRVLLWPDNWLCAVCPASGPHDDANRAAWDHLDTHLPKPKKRWWRR